MSLPSRAKQRLFLQLAQLLRSGAGLTQAADKLSRAGSGPVRAAAKSLFRRLDRGSDAGEAFAALSALDPMERACLASAARTGRLDVTLQRLADYFGVLDRARGEILRHCAYPVFILHFGLLATNLPLLINSGLPAFLREVLGTLLWIYAAVIAFFLLKPMVADLAAHSGSLDALLRAVPLLGTIRRDLSVARFFGTYDMQLDSGVNVIDSALAAAEASRSGLLRSSVRRALSGLREGNPLGPQLARGGGLPRDAASALMLAEESGELHRTLPQLQEEYERDGLRRLQIAAEWIPRLLYLGVAAYTGWKIIAFYKATLLDPLSQFDS